MLGVPLSVAVPSPLSLKVTPLGSVPLSLQVAAGKPVLVTEKLPAVPTLGVALSVAVPSPLSLNVTPPGSAPLSLKATTGKPVVVTEKLPAVPTANVVLAALVIAGASSTVSVNVCVASLPMP